MTESFIAMANVMDDGLGYLTQVLKLVDDGYLSVETVLVLMFSQFVVLSSTDESITTRKLTMALTRSCPTNRLQCIR